MRHTVHVKPGSSKGPLVVVADDGSLTVFLRERAVEGSANDGLVRVLADHFGVARGRITIARGQASRTKLVDVD